MQDSVATPGTCAPANADHRSALELAQELAHLERTARLQLLDAAAVLDGQLQQLIAIYERARGNVPHLQIEGDIRKARLLMVNLKTLPTGSRDPRRC